MKRLQPAFQSVCFIQFISKFLFALFYLFISFDSRNVLFRSLTKDLAATSPCEQVGNAQGYSIHSGKDYVRVVPLCMLAFPKGEGRRQGLVGASWSLRKAASSFLEG